MIIDIHTLAFVLSLTHFLQVIALLAQFMINKTNSGPGWWALGNTVLALGFVFNYLRDIPTLGQIAIVANNILFVSGMVFLYVGSLRFLGQSERAGWLIAFLALNALIAITFTYFKDDLAIRRVNISVAAAVLSFLITRSLYRFKIPSVNASANFLAFVFFANGVFFTIRALTPLISGAIGDIFTASLIQTATYLDVLISSSLWTMGFIIMTNQRMSEESREAKENQELIFNTTPDSVTITRLTDGYIVGVNDGFSMLTGFSRAEVSGKSTLEVNIWENPDDRQTVVTALIETGICKNLEFVFKRKDGSQFIGMLSARSFILRGVPHMICVARDITERKQAEDEILKADARLRTLSLAIEQSPVTTVITDLAGNIVFVNPKFTETTGYTAEEAMGQNPRILKSDKTSSGEYKEMWNTILSGQSWHGVFQNKKKTGDLYWESATISPVTDDKGAITHFLAVKEDITERKLAEEALRMGSAELELFNSQLEEAVARANEMAAQSAQAEEMIRERERSLNEAQYLARVGSWRFDVATGETTWSMEMFRIFGRDQSLGAPAWTELKGSIHPDDWLSFDGALRGAIADGVPYELEVRLNHPDGSMHWLLLTGGQAAKTNIRAFDWVSGTIQDITERKLVEDALRISKEQISQLLQTTDQGIYGIDLDGRCTFINQSGLNMLSYQFEDCIDKNMHSLIHHSHADGSPYMVEDCPIFRSKVTGVGIRLDSEVLWRKDGTSFSAEYSSSPIFDQGIIRGVVVTFSDITERKRLEEELQHQATTDELTGEINRRHFLSLAFGELTRAIRLEHPLSIALIDIDHFKSINDTYGHAVGDQALIVFSKICRQNIREIDVFARFGGDEFALLLPETSREQAFMTIERVRLVLADQPFVLAGKPVSITISSGIASLSSDQETFDVLLSRADQALYQAKEAGRNCVVQGQ